MVGPVRHVLAWQLPFVALMLLSLPASSEEIRYRLTDTVSDLQWTTDNGEQIVVLPGAAVLKEPGHPELPVRRLEFVIPSGLAVTGLSLQTGTGLELGSSRAVRRAPDWISDEGQMARKAPTRTGQEPWPLELAVIAADRIEHGYRIVTVEVRPAQVGADGVLRFFEEPEVIIELGPDPRAQEIVRRERDLPEWNARLHAELRRRVVNPQALATGGGPRPVSGMASEIGVPGVAPSLSSSPVRHLIITTEELRAEFERLALHRTNTGLPSHVVTIAEIVANARSGVDLAETIREYVRDAYSWWGVDYLLIGGDTEIIPARYARSTFYPAGGFTDIPTDQYFACLDGDWNADGDSRFGEHFKNAVDQGDYCDLAPEIAVGRAPVRDAIGAQVFVDKILQYEMPWDTSYQAEVLMAAEVLFPSDWKTPADPITLDGAALSETLIDSVFVPCADPTININRFYQNYTAWPGAVEESVASVNAALNSGGYGYFHHIGHGFYFNMSVGDAQLEVSHADALQNGPNWFVLYSLNCSSSAFDFNCLNERFLNNPSGGSVVSIGSARAAFPTAASEVQDEFFDALICDGATRVGDAYLASRAPFVGNTFYNTIERWTQFVYCLLGDPGTRLWNASPAQATWLSTPQVTLGDEQLTLTVIEDGGAQAPFEGVTVTARKGLEAYAAGLTDASGVVTLDVAVETAGDIEIWMSGGGVVPEQLLLSVQDLTSPVISVQTTTLADDGSGGSSGNGNGAAEAGETLVLTPLLSNGSSVAFAGGGLATLRSHDPLVTVSDSVLTLPAVGATGQAWASAGWTLDVSPDAPDGHSAVLEVELTPNGAGMRTDYVAFALSAPAAEIALLIIDDSAGNGNGIADVGEEVDLLFTLKNYGQGEAAGLGATISLVSGSGTVLDANSSWPDLSGPLDSSTNTLDPFKVRIDALPASVIFEFSLTDAVGRSHVRRFDLVAPDAVASMWVAEGNPSSLRLAWDPSPEPDRMGYMVYRKGPGDPDFILDTPDVLTVASTVESVDLIPLSNYEFNVVVVDSAGLRAPASPALATVTYPAEISCFPVRMGLETSGALAVGTVDHDFEPELVVGSDYVYVIDGNCTEKIDGDGDSQTLGPINDLAGQYQPSDIALGDLFKDELGMEIVAHDRDTKLLYVFDDLGNVMPGWPQALINWAWSAPVIGDVDGDGDLEIVINDISGYTYAFHHDGTEVADGDANGSTNGVIAPRRSQDIGGTIYHESFGRCTPALFDVDGDGAREILFGSKFQSDILAEFFYALKADGSGQNAIGWPKQFPPRSEFLASATIADLENNGTFDIIVPNENDSLYVWDVQGNLRPGFPLRRRQDSLRLGGMTPSPAVADFDNDGTLEILFVSIQRLGSSDWVSELELINADGSTWPGWPVQAPDMSESSPVIGDLNGDGSLDVVYGIGGVGADDAIYAFDSAGQILPGFPIPIDGFVRATPTIADLNRDGNVNLLSASWDSMIHVWDLLAPYDADLVPWPTFRGNVNRTGVYQEYVETAAPGVSAPLSRTQLDAPRPNPFNPATELSFVLENETSDLRLVIYDAQGRRVRVLASGEFGAGRHRARWDGTDDRGRLVASGVYFARLRVEGREAGARKLALVK
ncbi:hypothetical protein DRQ53_10745 [bacterium]|nr:MAG: hypothetical protein DRQ53_10745 [bacterium]